MKNEFVEIKLEASDIIYNIDDYFEDSHEWVNFNYSDINEYNIDFLKSLIPATKQKFLKNEDIKAIFKYDVVSIHEQAYIDSMASNLIDLISYHIEESISDNLPLEHVSIIGYDHNGEKSEFLTFSNHIIIKFKRVDVVKFQRSRNYYDRLDVNFENEVIDTILKNRGTFTYSNLDACYNWDNKETLKQLWDNYNETIPTINHFLKKNRNKLKDLIKNHVSIFKREQILEEINL